MQQWLVRLGRGSRASGNKVAMGYYILAQKACLTIVVLNESN